MWAAYKKGFKAYLRLERSLSENSVEAYLRDITHLTEYLLLIQQPKSPGEIELKDLQGFVKWVGELGMTATSQARIISGIRGFYKYCLIEQICTIDPSVLLEAPKTKNFVNIMNNLKIADKKSLLVLAGMSEAIYLSSRNLQKAKVVSASDINTYDLLNADKLVLTSGSVKTIEESLSK